MGFADGRQPWCRDRAHETPSATSGAGGAISPDNSGEKLATSRRHLQTHKMISGPNCGEKNAT
jgi:hypothetical protein